MIDVPLLLFFFHSAIAATTHAAAELFEEFSWAAAPVVMSALWQGGIVAAGLALSMRLARSASARHRFAIWAAGFAALVCLPFLSIWTARGEANAHVVSGANAGPWLRLDPRWSLLIGAAWILASAFRAAGFGVQALRLRRLWKSARPIENSEFVLSPVSESRPKSARLGLQRRDVGICTTTELDRPAVIGFFAPRILIPEWLFERLSPEELKHVVLHESEHLRRGDDWINLAQKLCLVLFPLNPALMWMDSKLSCEREMACDEGVVRATKAPRAYAACLASLAERGLKHRAELLSLGAWQRRPELVERVHRILKQKQGLSPLATKALVGGLSCGLVVGLVEFSHAPQLVAFAPATQSVTQERAASEVGDARYVDADYGSGNGVDARGAAGFHALDAVAQMPAAGRRAGNRLTRIGEVKQNGDKKNVQNETVPRNLAKPSQEVLLKAEMPNANAAGHEVQPQTVWIVFTAWQQVQGSGAEHRRRNYESGMKQDYDSPAAQDDSVSDGGTITRLVFRIYQPTASAADLQAPQPSGLVSSDSSTSNSSNSNLSGDQPAVISSRDGWFDFQL